MQRFSGTIEGPGGRWVCAPVRHSRKSVPGYSLLPLPEIYHSPRTKFSISFLNVLPNI